MEEEMEATRVKVGAIEDEEVIESAHLWWDPCFAISIEDEEVIESAHLWWDPCFAISGIWTIIMPSLVTT
ncbi:hypothetical protein PanWU01x14_142870 [Parasponia andersonii]|uniref:Uncharacterized protein n=1 Tax=Parasponia andersonii TaxID=3476 RepID=A0A2P5CLF9_PARAD|nr:hypothetical protein PanWU01x14_142870 [Parasponia andersonii]